MADVASYTLTNGMSRSRGNSSATSTDRPGTSGSQSMITDHRFRFQADDQLPKPRDFTGVQKRYRAGRGSSVPLDLSAFN